jgi:hypothetical protein
VEIKLENDKDEARGRNGYFKPTRASVLTTGTGAHVVLDIESRRKGEFYPIHLVVEKSEAVAIAMAILQTVEPVEILPPGKYEVILSPDSRIANSQRGIDIFDAKAITDTEAEEKVQVVIGMLDGVFQQVAVYRDPGRASREAEELRKEYGMKPDEETNHAVAEEESVIIEGQ